MRVVQRLVLHVVVIHGITLAFAVATPARQFQANYEFYYIPGELRHYPPGSASAQYSVDISRNLKLVKFPNCESTIFLLEMRAFALTC